MRKVIFSLFLFAGLVQSQERYLQDYFQSLTPRYIFVKKKDGSIQYHQLNTYRIVEDEGNKEKRLLLKAGKDSNFCVQVKKLPGRTLKRFKKSYFDKHDLFGIILDEKNLVEKKGHPSVFFRNGLLKS